MSNTALAYYKVKSPASILNSPCRHRDSEGRGDHAASRAYSGWSLRSFTLRALASALIILLAGVSQAQRPAAATHIVRHGESLDSIATAYGISLYELQETNNIWSWLIYAGQELEIPAGGNVEVSPNESAASVESPDPTETSPPLKSSGITHTVQYGETLAKIAAAYGVSLDDLQSLNHNWSWIIYVGQELEIPAGGTSPEVQDLPAEPLLIQAPAEPRTSTDSAAHEPPTATIESSGILHTVRFGESLSKIALAYGVSLTDLQSLNDIWTSILYVGHELEIPAGGTPPEVQDLPAEPLLIQAPAEPPTSTDSATHEEPPTATVESSGILHTVRFGESLSKIAYAYGVSLTDLQSLNDIWTSILYVGHELEIPAGGAPVRVSERPARAEEAEESPAPPPQPAVEASGIIHKVKVGETLAKIAAAYDVSLYELQALNDVRTWVIFVGQELEIPAGGRPPDAQDVPAVPEAEPAPTIDAASDSTQPKTHIVQRGETLFSIAQRYSVTLEALMRANGVEDATRIHAGNKLRVSRLDVIAPPPPVANDTASPAPVQAQAPPAAPANRPLPVVTIPPSLGIYPAGDIGQYAVRRGDFLTELGVRFNMDWRVLAEINNVSPPDYKLHPQQTLRLPTFAQYLSYLPDDSRYKLFYTTHHHPGPRVGVGREIVIELGRQSIYAYENGVLKKRALMSSGKMMTPTVLGDYEIYLKYRSQTMSGPGYSLDNVEWPMYFYAGYAIHGTWWHTMFGTPMSHGCVNLTNADAQWFWEFAPLGTPVHVRY